MRSLIAVMLTLAAPSAAQADVLTWGGQGSGPGQFRSPNDVAVAPNGDVYVADNDESQPRVQRFTAAGAYLGQVGAKGIGPGKYERPWKVAVAPDSSVFVLDYPFSGPAFPIEHFSSSGAFLNTWEESNLSSLVVGPNGLVYLTGTSHPNREVRVYHPDGKFAFKFGSEGGNPGQFWEPWDIDVDPSGRVYVLDYSYPHPPRVLRFSATGVFEEQWFPAVGPLAGAIPSSAAIGPEGDVYVLFAHGRVARYGIAGDLRTYFDLPRAEGVPFIYFTGLDFGGNFLYTADNSYSASSPARSARVLRVDLSTPMPSITGVGRTLTGTPVSFDASGSLVPLGSIVEYRWDLDGNGSFETSTGTNPVATHVYEQRGTLSVGLQIVSERGTSATAAHRLEVLPARPPGPNGVSIDGGAQFTNDPRVQVSVRWPNFASDLMISNDGGFFPFSQRPVDRTISWRLNSSGPERLPKTIYVRFLGGESGPETYQDDIILDETAPKLKSVLIEGGGGEATASARRGAGLKLRIAAADKVSGVRRMQITARKSKPGKWLRFRAKVPLRKAGGKIFVRVRDGAGNPSSWKRAKPAR